MSRKKVMETIEDIPLNSEVTMNSLGYGSSSTVDRVLQLLKSNCLEHVENINDDWLISANDELQCEFCDKNIVTGELWYLHHYGDLIEGRKHFVVLMLIFKRLTEDRKFRRNTVEEQFPNLGYVFKNIEKRIVVKAINQRGLFNFVENNWALILCDIIGFINLNCGSGTSQSRHRVKDDMSSFVEVLLTGMRGEEGSDLSYENLLAYAEKISKSSNFYTQDFIVLCVLNAILVTLTNTINL